MKVLVGPRYEESQIEGLFGNCVKRTGIIRRRDLESFRVRHSVLRSFRYVHWTMSDSETKPTTLIDEQLVAYASGLDESLLLWRPSYAKIDSTGFEKERWESRNPADGSTTQTAVESLISVRHEYQEASRELEPRIRKIHASLRSAAAVLLPRLPSSIGQEEKLLEQWKGIQGVLLATALVANCSTNSVLVKGEIGERVLIETHIAEYRDKQTGDMRVIALETPNANSLDETLSMGRALTRLCELSADCRAIVVLDEG
jgi:hypothetical protein